jgi:DNA-binding LacI/PurR family transcriptional regulator
VLDHRQAAELALGHLWKLGHREIAVIKGQSFTPDSEIRWDAIAEIAAESSRPVDEGLVVQIEDNLATPELGYRATQSLLSAGKRFTALFAFNDIAAIGAIRAIHEHGLRVPEDVSVVGFDDIESAAYQHPGLTTIRQPLRQMGKMAAQTVLKRIAGKDAPSVRELVFEPELIVRGTTAAVKIKQQQHSSHVIATA